MVITTLGIAFSGKIREEINKKGWFANKNQLQAIVEQDNSGTEIAEQSNQENSGIAVQDGSVSTYAVDTSNWDLTKVDIVYDTANVAVPVPKGYVASGADGEHTVNTGFVIYEGDTAVTTDNAWNESCTRNQWVWVPVPDVSRIYEEGFDRTKKSKLYEYSSTGRTFTYRYEYQILSSYVKEKNFVENKLQGMTLEKLIHEMQKEFEFTIESIKKYGGFYIGRYETGKLSEKNPVVQRMNTDISNQTWYTEYSRLQRLGTNENVKSNMIWGCLWDETLQWLVDSGNKTYEDITNSTSCGNYMNSRFTYKINAKGNTSEKEMNDTMIIPTGSAEYSKINNVYDMAGNVSEWTLESTEGISRCTRGGKCNISGYTQSVSYRNGGSPHSVYDGKIGFRAYLYIK